MEIASCVMETYIYIYIIYILLYLYNKNQIPGFRLCKSVNDDYNDELIFLQRFDSLIMVVKLKMIDVLMFLLDVRCFY